MPIFALRDVVEMVSSCFSAWWRTCHLIISSGRVTMLIAWLGCNRPWHRHLTVWAECYGVGFSSLGPHKRQSLIFAHSMTVSRRVDLIPHRGILLFACCSVKKLISRCRELYPIRFDMNTLAGGYCGQQTLSTCNCRPLCTLNGPAASCRW